eukprot:CAMPEP_0175142214 /NCGR_PEP_ID=MMETSP0087-20121206/12654_1 /TAXON_ID=136419 /ORGANISM="Unknown Unknown, Strain D1" /LENGTH=727 /DNA_ID=CAMNT_0016425951 /DNA_START=122 /DNA_END=2305 /DNA_ORIENTATION=-
MDGLTNDAFVVFEFGSMYKFKTHVKEKDLNPNFEFSADFLYSPNFVHRLHQEFLVVSVYDQPPFSSDKLIGTTKVDLHTVVTGAPHFQLSIWNEANNQSGLVMFDCVCTQVLRNMTCSLSNITIPTWESKGVDPDTKLQIQCFFNESSSKLVESREIIPSDALPFFPKIPDLDLTSDGTSLLEENSSVVIIVNIIVGDAMKEYGRAELNVLEHHRVDEQPVRFALPMQDASGKISNIFGDVFISGGPSFLQLPGPVSQVLTHDEGVSFSGTVPRGFPLPFALKGHPHRKPIVSTRRRVTDPAYKKKTEEVVDPNSAEQIQKSLIAGNGAAQKVQGVALPISLPSENEIFFASLQPPERSSSVLIVDPVPRQKQSEDDLVALPWGWSMRTDKNNHVFFRNHRSRMTTWQDPRFLPADWVQCISDKGKVFFVQLSTKLTTWVDPRALPPHWKCCIAKGTSKMVFHFKHKSGAITESYVDPRGLPEGTTQHMDAEKRREYFQDNLTETTSWDDPRKKMERKVLLAQRVSDRKRWEVKMLAKAAMRCAKVAAVRGKQMKAPKGLTVEQQAQYNTVLSNIFYFWSEKKQSLEADKRTWFQSNQDCWRDRQISIELTWAKKAQELRKERERLEEFQKEEMRDWEQRAMEEMARQRRKLIEEQEKKFKELTVVQGKTQASMLSHREDGLKHIESTKRKLITQRLIQYRMEVLDLVKHFESQVEKLNADFSSCSS